MWTVDSDQLWFDFTFQPDMDAIICSSCRRVTQPEGGSGIGTKAGCSWKFVCCGQLWFRQGMKRHKRLPFNFWNKYTWGDIVPKSIAPEEDVDVDAPDPDAEMETNPDAFKQPGHRQRVGSPYPRRGRGPT